MKMCILGNQARAMCNFWSVLIARIREQGHEVVALVPHPSPDDDPSWERALEALGARLVRYPLDRKGLNPLRDAATFCSLRRILSRERPDVLFAFTIKPVIYGAIASALAGAPAKRRRYVMITGLGYMFEADTPVKRVLMQMARLLYRTAFACVSAVFFQNNDDRELFARLSITGPRTRVFMSKGTGVDLERFTAQELPELSGGVTFLFVGRLLEAKGLYELAEAARRLKKEFPSARFQLLGPVEQGPGSVPMETVKGWRNEGILEYLGETRDVRPYLAEAHVVVLPSWREGLPTALLEAMAVGRALVAADAPGSRDVVREDMNGFLVPVRDPGALAAALRRFLDTPALCGRMGAASRRLAEEEYSATAVAAEMMAHMGL